MKIKRFTGVALFALLMIVTSQTVSGQNLKFGHIDSDELIKAMPEFEAANKQLESFRNDLVNALELMTVDFNNKNDTYQKELKNYTEIVRQTKEQELIDANKRIQEFQSNAQNQMQEKQAELFQPIYNKADKAIKDVGKEQGLVYVFDVKGLLYFDASKSTDILALVKNKLGVK